MRILFTIGRYWPAIGGAETLVRELASRLACSGEVTAVCLANSNEADFLGSLRKPAQPHSYRDGRTEVRLLNASGARSVLLEGYIQLACRSRWAAAQASLFAATYRSQLEDLVRGAELVHSLPAMSLPLVRLTAQVARRRKVPFVVTPHLHGAAEAVQLRDVFSCAAGIIALTSVEREWISAAGVPAEKIEVIGLGQTVVPAEETGRFRARYELSGPMILFIGRMESHKGYRQLLAAAPLVWREEPKAHFVFIGPGTPQSQRVFRDYRRERRIIEIAARGEEVKNEALTDCDLLCLPSTKESFGHVLLEAWAAGKPVIAADIPVERAIISPGEDGLLVEQAPEAVAEAILRLVKNPQLAREMGARGRAKVLREYSWERVAARTLACYERIVRERSVAGCPSAAC